MKNEQRKMVNDKQKGSPLSFIIYYLSFIVLLLLAFFLRTYQLDAAPPGWRDDELINSLVISQKALDGDWSVYYPDASGHEALYHWLNAIMLGLFGPTVWGIRYLSAIFGTLTVALTYRLGRLLLQSKTAAFLAAAALAVNFWGLMYSRTGIRHVSLPVFALLTFIFFWQGLRHNRWRDFALSGVAMGIGFYTYFASRGVPLILLAFIVAIFVLDRVRFWEQWRGYLLTLVVSLLLAVPLMITLANQPESEARVAELAVPIVEAQQGNFQPLQEYTLITLGMFHATGDNEFLYNIPNRPLFTLPVALLLWAGVAFSLWHVLNRLWRVWRLGEDETGGREDSSSQGDHSRLSRPYGLRITGNGLRSSFLLLWFLAGISPAFISVPPASLGHTILAQPAVFLLLLTILDFRLTIDDAVQANRQSEIINLKWFIISLGCLVIASIAYRDLPDYFINWPERGMVRFLYRADIHNVAEYLREDASELTDVAVSGLLAGPWDRLALEADLGSQTAVSPRWYNPERAVMLEPSIAIHGFPDVPTPYQTVYQPHPDLAEVDGGYTISQVNAPSLPQMNVCFTNGLCWQTAVYDSTTQRLELGWHVGEPLQLPPIPLISNPPPPDVYAGPRLLIFAQLQNEAGEPLSINDGLWVDPQTLQQGDRFRQQHWFAVPEGETAVRAVFGLYDPKTGDRILTEDGRDFLVFELNQ